MSTIMSLLQLCIDTHGFRLVCGRSVATLLLNYSGDERFQGGKRRNKRSGRSEATAVF